MEYVTNIIIFVNKGPVKCFVIFPYKLTKFVVGVSPVVTAAVLCRVGIGNYPTHGVVVIPVVAQVYAKSGVLHAAY